MGWCTAVLQGSGLYLRRVGENGSTFRMWEAMRHYFTIVSHGREEKEDGPVVDPHKPSILGSRDHKGFLMRLG